MPDKTSRTKRKRLPKGQRTHVRRVKQAARKFGITYRRPARQQTPDKNDPMTHAITRGQQR
jgi:hypothetical protein